MISPMIKYRFLLHHAEEKEFLKTLGDIGVVDITTGSYEPNTEESDMIKSITTLQNVIDSLKSYSFGKDISPISESTLSISDIISEFNKLWSSREELLAAVNELEKDINSAAKWGAFSVEGVNRLSEVGITMRYFSASHKDFSPELMNEYPISVISTDSTTVYFVAFQREGEEFSLPNIALIEYRALEKDISTLKAEYKDCSDSITNNDNELNNLCGAIGKLQTELDRVTIELRQHRIECGNRREADNSIVIVDGWIPTEAREQLDKGIAHFDSVITFSEMPIPEDNPPIKLRNSKLFSPAEMITRLYSLPNYNEADLTPFFTPFFIFFVGICLGDAIYGALILVVSLIAMFKAKPSLKPTFTLVMWCALAAMVMGAITGMYGGITVEATMLISSNNMFYFALAVGVLQLLYAMFLRAYFAMRRFGFVYGLSHLGWAMTIVTLLAANVMPMVGVDSFSTSSPLFLPVLILSLVLTIFFQNPKQNPLKNFGAGLWFLYNGLTGMLSDTLSYVRLFALGLSGGIIASVFNTLAVSLSPDVPIVKYLVMILILAIGHGINLFMSGISAFVHPLRLTFVEFYKNVGFEGGGKAYNPFSTKIDNNK